MDHSVLICPPQYKSDVCVFCLSVYVYTYCVVTGNIIVLLAHLPLGLYALCVYELVCVFSFTTLDTVRTGRPLSSATGMLQQGKHLTKPFSPICGQSVPVLIVFFSLLSHVLYVKLELLFGCICNDMLTYLSFNTSPKLLIQLLTAF